jgi:hypothetical protein
LGMRRMRVPIGSATKPRAREMIHSLAPIRVTWKAAPPMMHIITWATTAV